MSAALGDLLGVARVCVPSISDERDPVEAAQHVLDGVEQREAMTA